MVSECCGELFKMVCLIYRNRRMFGLLLGTLQRFRDDEKLKVEKVDSALLHFLLYMSVGLYSCECRLCTSLLL